MSRINHLSTALVIVGALFLTGCSSSGGDSNGNSNPNSNSDVTFNATGMINNLGNNIILAGYQELNASAAALNNAVNALETDGATEQEMDAAQTAWKAARVWWESGEGHIFGPIDALGTDPALDSWPLSTTDLQNILNTVSPITADTVRLLGNDVQGFHAIEYLLFGNGIADNDKTAAELTGDEIDYLLALGEVFQEHTQELVDGWTAQYDPDDTSTGPYIDEFTAPAANKVYVSQAAVVEEIINGMIGIVDEVGNGKISGPFGASAAEADTSLVESQYSWNSLTDFHNNIQSVRMLYTGLLDTDGTSTGSNGIYDFVNAHSATLAARVLDEINEAMDRIALVDGDSDTTTTDITTNGQVGSGQVAFRNAISDEAEGGRDRIQAAINALSTLQTTLQNDVLPLIADTTFN